MALTDAQERAILKRLVGLFCEVKEDLTVDDIEELIGRAANSSGLVTSGSLTVGPSLTDADATLYVADGERHSVTGTLTRAPTYTLHTYKARHGCRKIVRVATAQPYDVNIVNGGPRGNTGADPFSFRIPAGMTGDWVFLYSQGDDLRDAGNWEPFTRDGVSEFPVDPEEWGDLVGWYEPGNAGTTTSGGFVDSAPNLITSGVGPATATTTTRPAVETGWNGAPSWLFDGTNDLMRADTLGASYTGDDTPFTWVIAVQWVSVNASEYILAGANSANNNTALGLRSSSGAPYKWTVFVQGDAGGGTAASGATDIDTNRHIVSVIADFDPADGLYKVSMWLDGVLEIDNQDLNRDYHTFDRFGIGGWPRAAATAHANIRIGGMLLYASALTDEMREHAELYLRETWVP